jgi:hypothetical protein
VEFSKILHVEELIARAYVSRHQHSVEGTCNMREEELKKSLEVVYSKFSSYFDDKCDSCRVASDATSERGVDTALVKTAEK